METMQNSNSNAELTPSASHNHKPMLAEGNFVHPVRVQLQRTKGWKMPENTVSVCRPTKWGNPFKIGDVVTNQQMGIPFQKYKDKKIEAFANQNIEIKENWQAVMAYEFYVSNRVLISKELIRKDLKGKNLACFCPLDKECHADVLLRIANS